MMASVFLNFVIDSGDSEGRYNVGDERRGTVMVYPLRIA